MHLAVATLVSPRDNLPALADLLLHADARHAVAALQADRDVVPLTIVWRPVQVRNLRVRLVKHARGGRGGRVQDEGLAPPVLVSARVLREDQVGKRHVGCEQDRRCEQDRLCGEEKGAEGGGFEEGN